MPLAHAMWIHGHSLQIQTPGDLESVRRHGSAITLIGRPNSGHWFHLAIPTPVFVDDKDLRLDQVMLRLRTSGAAVRRVHVWDGDNPLYEDNTVSLSPRDYGFEPIVVPGSPHPRWGVGVSFLGEFQGAETERRIDVSAAGADFV